MELTSPRPVTVDDLQKTLLKPGEALLSYVLLPQQTVIFVVTRNDFRMVVSPVRPRVWVTFGLHAVPYGEAGSAALSVMNGLGMRATAGPSPSARSSAIEPSGSWRARSVVSGMFMNLSHGLRRNRQYS